MKDTSVPVASSIAVTFCDEPMAVTSRMIEPGALGGTLDVEARPGLVEGRDQRAHLVVVVERRRGEAQTLRPARHCGIVDRLNIDRVFVQQDVGDLLAARRIADEHGHDVADRGHYRQARFAHHFARVLALRPEAQLPEGTKIDPVSLLNVGIRAYNEGKYDKALESFNRVAAENPELADAYFFRALAYMPIGKMKEAKADFQKFLEMAPNHAKAKEAKEMLDAF